MYIKYSVRHYVIREPCMRRQVEKWSLISKFFLFLFLGSSSHVSHAIFAPLIGAESENCKNKSVNNHKLLLLHFHLYHVRLVCFFFCCVLHLSWQSIRRNTIWLIWGCSEILLRLSDSNFYWSCWLRRMVVVVICIIPCFFHFRLWQYCHVCWFAFRGHWGN